MPLRALWPRDRAHLASASILLALVGAFLVLFTIGNGRFLFDPLHHHDDARTSLMPFHRYGPEHALANDPSAQEMLRYVPPVVHGLYFALTKTVGLFAGVKVVQALAFFVVLAAGWVLLRSRRAGLAGAALLVFLFFHTPYLLDRTFGGLPRAFAFPALALWIAGAVAGRERVRWAATLLGAATYPSIMILLLAAEGLFTLRLGIRLRSRAFYRGLARYVVLVLACGAVMAPYLYANRAAGRVYTLAEAKQEPAFGRSGRLRQLPFPEPTAAFGKALILPLRQTNRPLVQATAAGWRALEPVGPAALLALLFLLSFTRAAPLPKPALSLLLGAGVCYGAAVFLAFRLYSPERFSSFGGQAAALALVVPALGLAFPRLPRVRRATIRNLIAAAFIFVVLLFGGSALRGPNGIEYQTHEKLYDFAKRLPVEARVLTHPMDGDDLPFWVGRATVMGYETMQPWYVETWKKKKAQAEELLRVLYATSREPVLDYLEKEGVTHLLLHRARYGPSFRRHARLFQPLGRFVAKLLRDVEREELVLAHVPRQAILYRDRKFVLVDAKRLRRAWRTEAAPPIEARQ